MKVEAEKSVLHWESEWWRLGKAGIGESWMVRVVGSVKMVVVIISASDSEDRRLDTTLSPNLSNESLSYENGPHSNVVYLKNKEIILSIILEPNKIT